MISKIIKLKAGRLLHALAVAGLLGFGIAHCGTEPDDDNRTLYFYYPTFQ